MGIALTGGLPITGEEARGGGTLSDKSRPSSRLIGGVRFGSSFIMDSSGDSCGQISLNSIKDKKKKKTINFRIRVCVFYLDVCD